MRSNTFLVLGLLSFCLLSTKPLLHTLSLWNTSFFMYFPNALELAVAPLIYFYVKSLITPQFRFEQKNWFHFVPFFISQAYSFVVYFAALGVTNFSEKGKIAERLMFDEVKQLDEYVLVAAIFFYLMKGYKMLINYKKWLTSNISDTSLPDFKWLKNLFQVFGITGLILLIGRLLILLSDFDFIYIGEYYWQFISLYIAFLIYYLGLRGYLLPNYVFPEIEEPAQPSTRSLNIRTPEIFNQVEKAMKYDLLFLDPKLSIQSLSTHLKLPKREVSQTINQHCKTNFRDFINNYRVEAVKKKLTSSEYSHMSILGIAMECGFNSEASFYRLFKKHSGLTPKEFLQKKDANKN